MTRFTVLFTVLVAVAMIAAAGYFRYVHGARRSLDLDANPALALT